MGRSVKIKKRLRSSNVRELRKPLRMWIVCSPGKDLKKARSEAIQLCEYLDTIQINKQPFIDVDINVDVSPETIKEKIKSYDIVHFVGHARYFHDNPENSGWTINEKIFQAKDIDRMAGGVPMPFMVFSNACQSAKTEAWHYDNKTHHKSYGLANSFMLSGVKHYIGTTCDIGDDMAYSFALSVYQSLMQGNSVGHSVKKARNILMAKSSPDVSWASYILYGDPTVKYIQTRGNSTSPPPPPPPPPQPQPQSPLSHMPNSKKNFISIGICIALFLCFMIIYFKDKPPKQLQIDPSVLKIFIDLEKEKEQTISQLLDKIGQNIDSYQEIEPQKVDEWTSKPFRLAIVIGDSLRSLMNYGLDEYLASVIESEIQNYPRIKLLDRMSLDDVLKELEIANSKLVNPANRLKPDLLPAKYLLKVKVQLTDNLIKVMLRLRKTITIELLHSSHIHLDTDQYLFDQKEVCTDELIDFIKKEYPIRGRITTITNKNIQANIGFQVGVKTNQIYKLIDKGTLLKSYTVTNQSSYFMIYKGNDELKEGDKIIYVENDTPFKKK